MRPRLSFEEFLLIAETVLHVPYEELERTVCSFRALASLAAPFARVHGAYLHPDPVERAAICALRLIGSRPLPRGNRAVAYLCMREMLLRSGYLWVRSDEDATEIAETLERLKAGEMGDAEFVCWVRSSVRRGTGLGGEATA